MLSSGLLMVHNTSRGGQNNIAKLSGRQKVGNPLLNVSNANVEARRNDTSLVETSIKLNYNFARSMVINIFKFVNVSYSFDVSTASKT